MAAYMRELMDDYIMNKLDVEDKVDIEIAIHKLHFCKQITTNEKNLVLFYIMGYNTRELEIYYPNVEHVLVKFFSLLAAETGYTDDRVLQLAIRIHPKFAKTREAYAAKLEQYGRQFQDWR